MRLSRIVIRRFKSIDNLEIRIPEKDEHRQGSADFVSIVGENNVGKSTIIEAIRLACPGSPKPTNDHFPYLSQSKGPIEVELEFNRLTEKDKEQHAVRAHVFLEDGVEKFLVKKIWRTAAAPEHWAYSPNKKQYRFRGAPEGQTKKELESHGEEGKAVIQAAEVEIKKGTRVTKDLLLQAAVRIGSPLIEEVQSDPWSQNPGGNPSNLDAVLPKVIYVPALRETGDVTDVGKKQSPIRGIVEALFERQLSKHEKVVVFRRAAAELVQLFDAEGKHQIVTHVESKITAKLQGLIDIRADLRFEAPDVTSDLASQTELRILQGDVSTKPEQQGHGAQRSIVLALLQLYAEQLQEGDIAERARALFLVEEPEIYMHPQMCRRMRDVLLKIAQSGVGQVICTTHSPVFLDLADRHDGIIIVRRDPRGVPIPTQLVEDVFKHTADDNEQRARLRMILNFDPIANEVFFSPEVCLVEGECEIAAIDAIARKLHELNKIDWSAYLAARRSVALVSCRGKWTILAFQKVLKAFGIKYRVVHDEDDAAGPRRANEQIRLLLTAKDSSLVHSPNFEKYVFNENWTRDKPWKATCKIRDAKDVDPKVIAFFEFVIGRKVEQLRESDDAARAKSLPPPVSQIPRQNLRAQLKMLDISEDEFQNVRSIEQVFRIAAGPAFAPDVPDGAQFYSIPGARYSAFAQVRGDSMADTLVDGDVVGLEMLDVWLWPVTEEAAKVTKNSFCDSIVHRGIYVLAINDDIDQRAYTMKRVRVHELVGGGWICQIYADNPEAAWGERGLKEIRKTDRVHFRAKVIGLVKQDEPPGSGVAEDVATGEE